MSEKTAEIPSELYSLLGEFTVEFEWVCYFLRLAITRLSLSAGNENTAIIKALMADMNALPLLRAFQSIAAGMRKLDDEEHKIISKIYNQTTALIEKRNDIIHGTWFARPPKDDNELMAWITGQRTKHTKKGVVDRYLDLSHDDFRPLIDECKKVYGNIAMVAVAFAKKDFSSNFVTNADGSISINPDRPKDLAQ